MKIAIDCRKISDGGIGTYIKNLLRCWKNKTDGHEFFLFCITGDFDYLGEYENSFKIIEHEYPKYSLRELFSFEKQLKKYNIDLFFSPHYTLPFRIPCRSIVTIHDLIHLRMPVKRGFAGRIYARYMISRALRKSDAVLTVSDFTKRDILKSFPGIPEKISVVYNGVDRSVFYARPPEEIDRFRRERSLGDDFILYVGALKKHKNPGALALAVNELNLPLVVASEDKESFEKILLSGVKSKTLVRLFHAVGEYDMSLLYNSAKLLFFPSLYEGFGLPPLEAMACGLPVVCSDRASIPEIVGDAAITFSPENKAEMIVSLKNAWEDRELRESFRRQGLERSANFNWENTADSIMDKFKQAVAG